jgi:hypothetical protein
LKDEQFLANPFNVIDYLADWFGWFVDVGHDASRLLFCGRKVGTLAIRITPLFLISAAHKDSQLLNDTGLGSMGDTQHRTTIDVSSFDQLLEIAACDTAVSVWHDHRSAA